MQKNSVSPSAPARPANARQENWGDSTEAPVTFDQFLASVYHPDNRDIFRRRLFNSVSDEDIRQEFVLALYRFNFPTDLTATRANHLLRHLAHRFVNLRCGDLARRRATRESPAARAKVAEFCSTTRRAPSPSESQTSALARLVTALAKHPAELTDCLMLAVRNVDAPSDLRVVAEAQRDMSPARFRSNLAKVKAIAEATGVL